MRGSRAQQPNPGAQPQGSRNRQAPPAQNMGSRGGMGDRGGTRNAPPPPTPGPGTYRRSSLRNTLRGWSDSPPPPPPPRRRRRGCFGPAVGLLALPLLVIGLLIWLL